MSVPCACGDQLCPGCDTGEFLLGQRSAERGEGPPPGDPRTSARLRGWQSVMDRYRSEAASAASPLALPGLGQGVRLVERRGQGERRRAVPSKNEQWISGVVCTHGNYGHCPLCYMNVAEG